MTYEEAGALADFVERTTRDPETMAYILAFRRLREQFGDYFVEIYNPPPWDLGRWGLHPSLEPREASAAA